MGEVTIAGAGALGLTCALVLAEHGAAVSVVDPGGAPNASAVAAGMLAPALEAAFDDEARANLPLLLAARDLWPSLAERIGVAIDRRGALAVGVGNEAERLAARMTAQGLSARVTSDGLFTDEDWRIEPVVAMAALRAAARRLGVRFRAGRVTAKPQTGLLIVATGASKSLVAQAPELAGLSPIKGHILTAPDVRLGGPMIRFDGGYICPAAGGAMIGASMEFGVDDATVDPAIVGDLLLRASRAVQALKGARVIARTGVRAATADGRPLVGGSCEEGVFLAAGARRNGWLLAPLVAARLADALSTAGLIGS